MTQVSQAGADRALSWRERVNCTLVQAVSRSFKAQAASQNSLFLLRFANFRNCGCLRCRAAGGCGVVGAAGWVWIVWPARWIGVVWPARWGGRSFRVARFWLFRHRSLAIVWVPGRRGIGSVRVIWWIVRIVRVVRRRISGLLRPLNGQPGNAIGCCNHRAYRKSGRGDQRCRPANLSDHDHCCHRFHANHWGDGIQSGIECKF